MKRILLLLTFAAAALAQQTNLGNQIAGAQTTVIGDIGALVGRQLNWSKTVVEMALQNCPGYRDVAGKSLPDKNGKVTFAIPGNESMGCIASYYLLQVKESDVKVYERVYYIHGDLWDLNKNTVNYQGVPTSNLQTIGGVAKIPVLHIDKVSRKLLGYVEVDPIFRYAHIDPYDRRGSGRQFQMFQPSDVLPAPTAGELPHYDAAGNLVNSGVFSGTLVMGKSNLVSPGSVPFVSTAGTLNSDPANFSWDATNKRLGIGTGNPRYPLDVIGDAAFSGTLSANAIVANTISGNLAGNANTATKFAGTPQLCEGGQVSTGINASGDAQCMSLGAVTGTSLNTPSTVVARDGTGNFSAGTITANLVGNVTGNVSGSAGSVPWTGVSGRPTALSAFTNDAGFITATGSITGSAGSVAWTGVSGRPTALSQFTNDTGFITSTWTGSSSITTIGTLAAGTVPWARLSNVPTSFTAAAHAATHASAGTDPITSLGAVSHSGSITFATDNTYDIGASGANRPRHMYIGTNLTVGSSVQASKVSLGYGTSFVDAADGVIRLSNGAATDFGRLMFGGTTASFPALKRSGTTLAFRLADDTGDAPLAASSGTFSGSLSSNSISTTTISASETNGGYVKWVNTGQAADNKVWDSWAQGSTLAFRVVNDAMSSANTWLSVSRTGIAPNKATFYLPVAVGGNLTFSTDNTYDVGAGGATRPKTVYIGTSLGIGTTATPLVTVEAVSANTAEIDVKTTHATSKAAYFSVADVNGWQWKFGSGLPGSTYTGLAFAEYTNGTYTSVNMYLAKGGNVGIGTTSPAYLLSLQNAANTPQLYLKRGGAARWGMYLDGNDSFQLAKYNSSDVSTGNVLTIDAGTSNVGIGTNTPTSGKLVVDGGHLTFGTDNTYDVGASAANRPRNIYAGTSIQAKYFGESAYGATNEWKESIGSLFVETAAYASKPLFRFDQDVYAYADKNSALTVTAPGLSAAEISNLFNTPQGQFIDLFGKTSPVVVTITGGSFGASANDYNRGYVSLHQASLNGITNLKIEVYKDSAWTTVFDKLPTTADMVSNTILAPKDGIVANLAGMRWTFTFDNTQHIYIHKIGSVNPNEAQYQWTLTRSGGTLYGPLGVGTTPGYMLHVSSPTESRIVAQEKAANKLAELGVDSSYAFVGTKSAHAFQIRTTDINRMTFDTSGNVSITAGNLTFGTDNTYDIGASGANRPKNVWVAGNVNATKFLGDGSSLSGELKFCTIENDSQSTTVLTASNLTGTCEIPVNAHIVEVAVWGGTGTGTRVYTGSSSVQITRLRPNGGTTANILTAVLATPNSSGVFNKTCARATISTACVNTMTSSGTVTLAGGATVAVNAGDLLYITSPTADGVQTWYTVTIFYTVD